MSLVTTTLLGLIRKQVEVHGTVVWYDPEKVYLDLAAALPAEALAGATVRRYDPEKGFFWLRHELEPLWRGADPPRLVLYVPLSQADTQYALIEFEVAGVVMKPGQQPPDLNTALVAVTRRALQDVFPAAALEEILANAGPGQLSLHELDDLAEKGLENQSGTVAVIFGTGNPTEVALRFLADTSYDSELASREALPRLASLLSGMLDIPFPADQNPAELRARLARQLLSTDLIESLGDSLPPALRTMEVAERPVARQAAVELAREWRNRRDLVESYVAWAGHVQKELGVEQLDLDVAVLSRIETFPVCEERLQGGVEKALLEQASAQWVDVASTRLKGFWSALSPTSKARWDVVADAGQVLLETARVESALKGKNWSAAALWSQYTTGDAPWCLLDTAQRHLERDFHRFEVDLQQHASLLQLVSQARSRYSAVSNGLAELFTQAYAQGKFELSGALQQTEVYARAVLPAANAGRVAYILVDALRYEVALELLGILEPNWTHELQPAVATPPTVTEVGMAGLLPGAEKGIAVVPGLAGKLAAVVSGKTLRTRQERMAHLATAVPKVVVARLDQLAPLADIKLGREIQSADLVVVTSSEEIDGLCENLPAQARTMLDEVFNQLRRAIKSLFGQGIATVIISADHGYLFGEALTSGQGIDAPGGETVALKRRVWVGKGGAGSASYLRAPLSDLGIGGDLEIATPWNLSCFKVKGGAMEYFHGGLSLQELAIPVLTIRAHGTAAPTAEARVHWTLVPGSQTISTRFFSVTVKGHTEGLWPVTPPLARVEVRVGTQVISTPVSATYGFQEATGDVQLALDPEAPQIIAANTITLMIEPPPAVKEVTVYLLDATTGVSLTQLERFPIGISI